MAWTLEHAGQTKTIEQWGFTGLRRTLASAVVDVVTFECPVEGFDEDTALTPQNTVKIYKDGVKWFEGVVTQTPLTALPDAETHGYVISGPWYHFEENVYKQPWLAVGGSVNIGHILMNITVGQALFPTNLQMTSICNWLLSLFPGTEPFQIGSIDPVAYPPVSEVNAITCAAAMRSQLRWIPDGVVWFDYSTSPPSLYVKQRSGLAAVNVTIPDADMNSCTIVPRYDLVRPSVSIHYEIASTVNGKSMVDVTFDTWPLSATGNEPRALNLAMNLQGVSRTVSFAEILTDDIDTSSTAWWKERAPHLKDERVEILAIESITRKLEDDTASQSYPRELIEGQITDWMDEDWEQEVITARITYAVYDSAASNPSKITLGRMVDETIAVKLVSTTAVTQEYSNVTTDDVGDPLPVGMAQFLYEALSVLHYDGQFSLVEEEITGQVGIGNVVNLTGGRVAWASMNALVQSITEDVDTGHTRVIVGPPKHLGHDDLMELLRVGWRQRWTAAATQETGELGDAGEMRLGKPTANRNTSPGKNQYELLRIQGNTTSTNFIKLDAVNKTLTVEQATGGNVSIALADIPAGTSALVLPIKIREVEVCVNNVTMRMLVIGSAPYAAPP